jgi:hypothetical protein
MKKQQLNFIIKMEKKIELINISNGLSDDHKRVNGYRYWSEKNTCPICQRSSQMKHETGIMEGNNLVWYYDCRNCRIEFKEVYCSNGHKYYHHEIQ